MTPIGKSMCGGGGYDESRLSCHREWKEIPDDVLTSILSRLESIETLTRAEMVCKTWYRVCKDPVVWRTIRFTYQGPSIFRWREVYELATRVCPRLIDRSSGTFTSIRIDHLGNNQLLKYISNSSTGFIRCLSLVKCDLITDKRLCEAVSRFPLLEDLDISECKFSSFCLQSVGSSCPLLKSFKFNDRSRRASRGRWKLDLVLPDFSHNSDAVAISENMQGLVLLEIRGNEVALGGLGMILDYCPHLQSLDLNECRNVEEFAQVWRQDMLSELKSRMPPTRIGHPNKSKPNKSNDSALIPEDYIQYVDIDSWMYN